MLFRCGPHSCQDVGNHSACLGPEQGLFAALQQEGLLNSTDSCATGLSTSTQALWALAASVPTRPQPIRCLSWGYSGPCSEELLGRQVYKSPLSPSLPCTPQLHSCHPFHKYRAPQPPCNESCSLLVGTWYLDCQCPHPTKLLDFMPFSLPPNLGFIPQLPSACSQHALVALTAPAGVEL